MLRNEAAQACILVFELGGRVETGTKIGLGVILALAGIGGLYGKYLKTAVPAASDQATGITMFQECMSYNISLQAVQADMQKVGQFLDAAQKRLPDVTKSDGVVAATAAVAGAKPTTSSGIGEGLSACVKELSVKYTAARKLEAGASAVPTAPMPN
ncbi:MAG TPA: hypothetical protein VFP33_02400 [Gallionella sp.]|nr:hypothetical protein [Gallionella sp.]